MTSRPSFSPIKSRGSMVCPFMMVGGTSKISVQAIVVTNVLLICIRTAIAPVSLYTKEDVIIKTVRINQEIDLDIIFFRIFFTCLYVRSFSLHQSFRRYQEKNTLRRLPRPLIVEIDSSCFSIKGSHISLYSPPRVALVRCTCLFSITFFVFIGIVAQSTAGECCNKSMPLEFVSSIQIGSFLSLMISLYSH